jgi:hypothetical protein
MLPILQEPTAEDSQHQRPPAVVTPLVAPVPVTLRLGGQLVELRSRPEPTAQHRRR